MNALKKKKLKSSTGFLPKQYILNVSRMPIQPRTPLPRAVTGPPRDTAESH